jgi:hypothetical protein
MANPVPGSAVKYIRYDDVEFNALVLSDEGPGFVAIAYVDTTAVPAFVAVVNPVPVAAPNGSGLVIA